jgi:SNF2 family DNA or RNA helicase
VRVPDWWKARKRPEVRATVGRGPAAGVGQEAILDFSVELVVDGEPLTAEERARVLAASSGLTLIKGKWVEIDRDRLAAVLEHWETAARAHARGLTFAEGMRLLSGVSFDRAEGEDAAESEKGWSRIVAGPWLSGALDELRDPERTSGRAFAAELRAELRPYQLTGVRWLAALDRLGLGACLADDMGLGKTIQVLALLASKKRVREKRAPGLLVVPASLIANWTSEIERFAPSVRTFVAHPSVTPSAELADLDRARIEDVDLVITTYGTVQRTSWFADVVWSTVILDEAQAIKNAGTKQARAVKSLKSRMRIALTGTPIENRLADLWSIFDFLNPGLLGSAKSFSALQRRLERRGHSAFGPLRELIRPYVLRRLKTDKRIIADLPDKTEQKTWCTLTRAQAVHYEQAVRELKSALASAEGIERKGVVLSSLMRLKQICNHPSQWLGDGAYELASSGKLQRLTELCEELASRQAKVLVFTQFREMTAPLASALERVFGRSGLVLHGDTPVKQRRSLVDAFQDELGPPFFVLSLKAGGTGLNLTAASHVIHFDRWWNPAVEDQATDRAFRIGQKKNVFVHKFVCRGTIEERIDAMVESKRGLSAELFEGGSEVLLTELSNEELLRMVALDIHKALEEN